MYTIIELLSERRKLDVTLTNHLDFFCSASFQGRQETKLFTFSKCSQMTIVFSEIIVNNNVGTLFTVDLEVKHLI